MQKYTGKRRQKGLKQNEIMNKNSENIDNVKVKYEKNATITAKKCAYKRQKNNKRMDCGGNR